MEQVERTGRKEDTQTVWALALVRPLPGAEAFSSCMANSFAYNMVGQAPKPLLKSLPALMLCAFYRSFFNQKPINQLQNAVLNTYLQP